MKLHVLAVGTRMPAWVDAGWKEYARRLPADCALVLHEIRPEPRRSGKTAAQLMQAEAARLRAAIPAGALVIGLDERGRRRRTEDLARDLEDWRHDGRDRVFLIGGPDGLEPALKAEAHALWQLSDLTLPHPLVRIVLAEQIYRAWAIINNHPYHRA